MCLALGAMGVAHECDDGGGVVVGGDGVAAVEALQLPAKRATMMTPLAFVAVALVLCALCSGGALSARFALLGWAALAECAALAVDVAQKWSSRRRQRRIGAAARVARSTPPKKFTWQELAAHNTRASAYLAIRGEVYDVTDFLARHPGGAELLLLCCGRDATQMFDAYHPFSTLPQALLRGLHVGQLSTSEHATFRPDSGFYAECRRRVGEYFAREMLDPKAAMPLGARMAAVYAVMAVSFTLAFALGGRVAPPTRLLMALLFGVCQGVPLTGWMHDASHAAIGHGERGWRAVGRLSLDWIAGSSMLSWHNQHVIGHHVYTNVFGADPDLPVSVDGDVRRVAPSQRWRSLYRYQHLYMPVLYGVLGIKSRVQDVTEIFAKHRNGPIRVNPISVQDYLRLSASKSFWVWYRFVVPCWLCGAAFLPVLALSFVADLVVGYWLAFNFQVSHVSTECAVYGGDGGVEEEWAPLQVRSSVDYAHGSAVATFLSGGLNYQTAHHLFPSVGQCHLPAITPIVMDVCRRHGIAFNVLPDYSSAIGAHLAHLKQMGERGEAAELKLE